MRAWLLLIFFCAPILGGWFHFDPPQPSGRAPLQGIWDRVGSSKPKVQFYYFHTDDSGLYRFGSKDLNHTEMFDRRWRGDRLEIIFRKTGERRATTARIVTGADGRRELVLEADPRNGGRRTRYRRRPAPGPSIAARASQGDRFARMWMHRRSLVSRGQDFRIYQFQPSRSGHGHGWHHWGDFDEWTTEALQYHRGPKGLHLRFVQRGERAFTPHAIRSEHQPRLLVLEEDPRYFGRKSAYIDAGPTLMTEEAEPLGWVPPTISTETL